MNRYCKQCKRTKSLQEFKRNERYQMYSEVPPYREIVDHSEYDKSFQRQCMECNTRIMMKRKNKANLILQTH